MKSTTSIRLAGSLRKELEQASRQMHRGISWIIEQAIKRYLSELSHEMLIQEARRQSLLASGHKHSEEDLWEDGADFDSWKADGYETR